MGDLLAVIYIGTILVLSGLVLMFRYVNDGGSSRRWGIWLLVLGLLVYLAAWFFTPDSPYYHLNYDPEKHRL
ncbi:MAG: hypothetical protein JNM41_10575 [Flavipsychrobacter sp.]|nr:hypothetical protein [Flavipsychrobacter sp.]